MSKKYKTIMISGAIIAVLLIAFAIGLGLHNSSMAAYSAKLAEADKMLEERDYTNAILKYQEAIDDKPKEEDGYLRLAAAYEITGHEDYALQTIESGLVMLPDSEKLLARKEALSTGIKKTVAILIDSDMLTSLAAHSFYDYGKTGRIEKTTPGKNGEVLVRVKGVNADLIYRNTGDQPEAVSGSSPSAESVPAEVRFDDVMSVLGGGTRAGADDLKSLGVKNFKIAAHQEYGTAVTFTYELFDFTIESDSDGNITSESRNTVAIPSPSVRGGADIGVQGTVVNAVTGEGVPRAKLTFRNNGGGTSFETVTDSSGHYTAKLGSGDYTVSCKADGFVEEDKSVYVPSSLSDWTCDLVMSPEIAGGEARIVLTWGSYPTDLDSHLIGNGVHVSFMDPVAGSIADLDIDDMDGYGPETTTIHDLSGSYTFIVHDYTMSGALADSGAEVTVYLPGQAPVTISIGGSGGSDTWVVCSIDNGHLNIINEIRDYDL